MIKQLSTPIDPLLVLSEAADYVHENPEAGDAVAGFIARLFGEPNADRAEVLTVLASIRQN